MDIKRTVLLVIFSLSLLMLWENWTIYNGGASMFAPEVASTSNNATANTKTDSSVPQASVSTPAASGSDVPAGAAIVQAGEKITITTDLLKAEINTAGAELTRIELLKHKDGTDQSRNVVLMESGSGRTYVGQSGLIGTAAPNHRSLFMARPGIRTLEGANSVQLILDAEQDGVKLTKTYTFKRGEYEIELTHEVTNGSSAAITPSVYVQLVRDDSKLEGDSRFYSTFTGPAIYTDAEKFRKVTFEDIDKGKQPPAAQTDKGWIAMVQHYFVSAFQPLDKGTHELFTRKINDKLYAVGVIMKMGSIAPGAKAKSSGKLYTGPQESTNLEKFAPDFDLVKD
jgi:YidC/Oxa1 family membrane protein insertase